MITEKPKVLKTYGQSNTGSQGQTVGHPGFLLTADEAAKLVSSNPTNVQVVKPFLTARDLFRTRCGLASTHIVDFSPRTLEVAERFEEPFRLISTRVLADRLLQIEGRQKIEPFADDSDVRFRKRKTWWLLSYPRAAFVKQLRSLPRYLVCDRRLHTPLLAFVRSNVNPAASLQIFAFADDYAFGILQSALYRQWNLFLREHRERPYTPDQVYDSFPWPQRPSPRQIRSIARHSIELRHQQSLLMRTHDCDLYTACTMKNTARQQLETKLDYAVRTAYGLHENGNDISSLIQMNRELANRESIGLTINGPGVPTVEGMPSAIVSSDCFGT